MSIKLKYDWDDITIVPANVSQIESRSQIDIFENGKLPLMVAPMDRVISPLNADIFVKNNIQLCFPRNINTYEIHPDAFYSFGIDELEQTIIDGSPLPPKVLIDVANGNMQRVIDLGKNLKGMYDVILMVGNIANPETYRVYCENGFDYARCSVGSGSACHVGGTKIRLINSEKNIEDVEIGDLVLTHKNTYERVYDVHVKETSDLYNINDNVVTSDHKYYVVKKDYLDILTDDNVEKYAVWVTVSELNDTYCLLGM